MMAEDEEDAPNTGADGLSDTECVGTASCGGGGAAPLGRDRLPLPEDEEDEEDARSIAADSSSDAGCVGTASCGAETLGRDTLPEDEGDEQEEEQDDEEERDGGAAAPAAAPGGGSCARSHLGCTRRST